MQSQHAGHPSELVTGGYEAEAGVPPQSGSEVSWKISAAVARKVRCGTSDTRSCGAGTLGVEEVSEVDRCAE